MLKAFGCSRNRLRYCLGASNNVFSLTMKMTDSTLDPRIVTAFRCTGTKQNLVGGEGRSVRVGQCVFKPIEHPERYGWACEVLLGISKEGFRISEPRQTVDGSFVYQGWGLLHLSQGSM